MTVGALVAWDGYTADALAHRFEVPHVELLAETDSTLDVAHALAGNDAPAGTVIVADSQRAGRGQHGRSWSSRPGLGVWCTVIERPRGADAMAFAVLSVRTGLRVAKALDTLAGERVGLKWPNDLTLRAGKLGGILAEARWSGSSPSWVAVGVGINVVPPPDVTAAAALSPGVERVDVLEAIVRAVRSAGAARGALTDAELNDYHARDTLLGRRIVAPGVGRVTGISADGALVVELADGEGTEVHRAGSIRLAEDA
jgi:BirA family biotin operon repressor/biotin-[acetyl-CoA-carboxylase] ligase